jgi:competence protein ComEC
VPLRRLSYSALSLYRRCGYRYFAQRVLGLPEPDRVGLEGGGLDPLELFDPGFQLSFSAVVAIFVVAPKLRGTLGQAAAVSVACTVVTAPIVWWHFGRATPLAIPANLLALPAVAPILWLALVAMLARLVWAPLATPLLGLADVLAAYVLAVAAACS